MTYTNNVCHGCGGKGWIVNTATGGINECIICDGTGVAKYKYKDRDHPFQHQYKGSHCPNAGGMCFCTGACMRFDTDKHFDGMENLTSWNAPAQPENVNYSEEENNG